MQGAHLADGKWRYPVRYGYADVEVGSVIEERFSLPVSVRHDPECMLYAVADKYSPDSMSLRVDNDIGVAAMKNGKVLDVPLDLGHIYIGNKKLKTILNEAQASNDYSSFSAELGRTVANLAKLLGLKKVFVVGEIVMWFDKVKDLFDKNFKMVTTSVKYEVSDVENASEGAARIAMTEYPRSWQCS
jgi:predicted NBD/HSP70 family sugar kinase